MNNISNKLSIRVYPRERFSAFGTVLPTKRRQEALRSPLENAVRVQKSRGYPRGSLKRAC